VNFPFGGKPFNQAENKENKRDFLEKCTPGGPVFEQIEPGKITFRKHDNGKKQYGTFAKCAWVSQPHYYAHPFLFN
jgi:hypothetical protein